MFTKILILILSFSTYTHAKSCTSTVENQIGKRISECANSFLGTPYDSNPLGEYVARNVIVYDEKVDCMYLAFRCTEIALASDIKNENKAIEVALSQRFHTKGVLKDGRVLNYQDRFDYGEDMIRSPKWGDDVSNVIGRVSTIEGARGVEFFSYVTISDVHINKFQDGDIIFFVKSKEKRIVGEIIAHIGIVNVEADGIYMIHASGSKTPNTKGRVVKVPLHDYLAKTKFIGIAVKRLNDC